MRSVTIMFILTAGAALWLERSVTKAVAQSEPTAQETQIEEQGSEETKIEELTAEEIEAELKRAQELLEDPDAPTEFVQAKPLPADIAIDMPSDI